MNTMLRATALGVVALLLGIFCILVRYDQIISVATEFTIVAAILLIAASFVVVKISLSPLKVSITPDSERSDRHKQGIASFGIGEALFVVALIAPVVLAVWMILGWWSWGRLRQGPRLGSAMAVLGSED